MYLMCKKCLLHTKIPNVTLNEEGLCNACAIHEKSESDYAKRFASKKFLDLIHQLNKTSMKYNAIVMLSGGKDSMFLLDLAKNEYHLKVLAVSVFHPLMNETARENVETICAEREVDLVSIVVDEEEYKKIMHHGIVNRSAYQLDEFFGCYLCSNIFRWMIIQKAMEYKIPLVLDGSDKSQTEEPYYMDAKRWVRDESFAGKPLGVFHNIVCDALGESYQSSQFNFERDSVRYYYPTIVAPLTFMEVQRYIVNKKNMNKIFTNCDAVPFFSVFSIKNYDCVPYIRHYSNELRNGYSNILQLKTDYNFKEVLPKKVFTDILDEYKSVILFIISQIVKNGRLQFEDREAICNMASTYASTFGDEVCLHLLDSVMKIPDYFEYFKIDIQEAIL